VIRYYSLSSTQTVHGSASSGCLTITVLLSR
jgi:hypothetical protein